VKQRRLLFSLLAASLFALPCAFRAFAAPAPQSNSPLDLAAAALQAGEADKALALLASPPPDGSSLALSHNLLCRVRFSLGHWDAAATECAAAVHLDPQSSDYHMWLGRALGEKAGHASFLTAFSLAKQARAEFETAVQLNPHNAPALADLGDFYTQAPSVVGGGIDKARQIAASLQKVDGARAHELLGHIAEDQKDFSAAEREYRQAIAADTHPALRWTTLAGFFARRKQFDDMESAVHSAQSFASRDKYAAVAFYDGAGVLIEAKADPALAANLLQTYLDSSFKSEEAPAFKALVRLARLKAALGDPAAAQQERAAALSLARDYRPAQDFKLQDADRRRTPNPESQQANL